MDADAGVNVAHGLTLANIRSISVIIRRDDDALYSPIDRLERGNIDMDGTNVLLTRINAAGWDNVNYDATSYNRGWITLHYV